MEYQCESCETLWVLADRARFLRKVVRKELYAQWKSRSWLPTSRQMGILKEIAGAADHDEKNVYYPCQINLPGGRLIAKAILVATTGDCFGKFPLDRGVSLLAANHGISPSDFALPAEVRAATMVAREKSMGYAPVNVRDNRGKRYTLSGEMHLFARDGIRGPDLSLDESPYHGKNIVHPDGAEMYLICDMFDGKTAPQR